MPQNSSDDGSEHASMPDLEPASYTPPLVPLGLAVRTRVFPDASIPVITDRQCMDVAGALARLNSNALCEFILDVAITADRDARLFLHFHIVPCNDDHSLTLTHPAGSTTTYRISWCWLRGLVYLDDRFFWLAAHEDLNLRVISDPNQRFAGSLQGSYIHLAAVSADQPDAVMDDSARDNAPELATAREPEHAHERSAGTDAPSCAIDDEIGPDGLPVYSLPLMREVQAPNIAPPLPIYPIASYPIIFGIGIPSFRHFYIGANSERVSVRANWLVTDRLMANVDRPVFSPQTPTWAKSHYSELEAKEVVTCDASNICGIDYIIRLTDNETVRICDTCLDWIKRATEAAQRFWREGHCLRADIAEQMLHQRPIAYATPDWDAALLEWSSRKVNISHVYKIENGSLVAVE